MMAVSGGYFIINLDPNAPPGALISWRPSLNTWQVFFYNPSSKYHDRGADDRVLRAHVVVCERSPAGRTCRAGGRVLLTEKARTQR